MDSDLHAYVHKCAQCELRDQELELPSIMASLDICNDHGREKAQDRPKEPVQSCSILKGRQFSNSKRRCLLKPTKLPSSNPDMKGFEYRQFSRSELKLLETIYEEPLVFKNDRLKHIGCSKPRKIHSSSISKAIMKHRKSRIKKTNSCRVRIKRKLNMDEFIARFHELMGTKETNESTETKEAQMTSSSI